MRFCPYYFFTHFGDIEEYTPQFHFKIEKEMWLVSLLVDCLRLLF